MKKKIPFVVIAGLLVLLAFALAGAQDSMTVVTAVSPQTMILGSDQGTSVTVHAEIPYSTVDKTSLTLNGIPAKGSKSDNRGELVAFFNEEAVKSIVSVPSATLTLEGLTTAGGAFSGSDTVRVILAR